MAALVEDLRRTEAGRLVVSPPRRAAERSASTRTEAARSRDRQPCTNIQASRASPAASPSADGAPAPSSIVSSSGSGCRSDRASDRRLAKEERDHVS